MKYEKIDIKKVFFEKMNKKQEMIKKMNKKDLETFLEINDFIEETKNKVVKLNTFNNKIKGV